MAKVFPLPWFMKCQALVADCSVVNWALSPSCSAWAGFYGKSTHTSQQSWSVGILPGKSFTVANLVLRYRSCVSFYFFPPRGLYPCLWSAVRRWGWCEAGSTNLFFLPFSNAFF